MNKEKITLEMIKNFAEIQFSFQEFVEPPVTLEDPEFSVCDPWMDRSGRWKLNDELAQGTYGRKALDDFIYRAQDYIADHLPIRFTQIQSNDTDEYTDLLLIRKGDRCNVFINKTCVCYEDLHSAEEAVSAYKKQIRKTFRNIQEVTIEINEC